MRKSLLLAALVLFFISACKTHKTQGNAPILLSYSRTPCFGNCEVFDITIYTNGKVDVNKKRFMSEIGQFEGELKKKEIKHLEAQLEQMSFCSMDSIFGAGVSDLPSSIITYNCGNRYKTIKATMGYPETLKGFIEDMALLAKRVDLEPVVFD